MIPESALPLKVRLRRHVAHKKFVDLLQDNPLFCQFVMRIPSASEEELLEAWKWVQDLTQKTINRVLSDLGRG